MRGRWLVIVLVAVVVLGLLVWASDKIGLQGERTVYTVQCTGGVWEELKCTGSLTASERYRFRASRRRQEVLFWIVGSSVPSGKFTDCVVKDRGDWSCRQDAAQPATITHAMSQGQPVRDPTGRSLPFHAVSKWKWWMLKAGIRIFSTADS